MSIETYISGLFFLVVSRRRITHSIYSVSADTVQTQLKEKLLVLKGKRPIAMVENSNFGFLVMIIHSNTVIKA